MPTPINPDRYDPATAAAMAGLDSGPDGLPAYLGIRTTHVGPARFTWANASWPATGPVEAIWPWPWPE